MVNPPHNPVARIQEDHIQRKAHEASVDAATGPEEEGSSRPKRGAPHQPEQTLMKTPGDGQVGHNDAISPHEPAHFDHCGRSAFAGSGAPHLQITQ
jgi:hypothetical protein